MLEVKRVLVVDDERGILRFTRVALRLAGYDVLTASGGEEGLRLAEADHPDIIVLDLVMAPVSGFDVLARLRCFSQVPVIVLSAQSYVADRALTMGASATLPKPFLPADLTRKIREILEAKIPEGR